MPKKTKKQPKIRVDRKIYFYRAVSRTDKGGKPGFKPANVYKTIKSLTWKECYKDEDGGKQTFCWVSTLTSAKFGIIRRIDLPQKEKYGRLSSLPIPRGTGLAEKIHIVFFENNIIGADYNFYGPSMAKFAEYLLVKGKYLEDKKGKKADKNKKAEDIFPKGLHFEPLLRKDAVDRLEKMKEIRFFQLRIKKSFAENLSDASRSLAAAFKAAGREGKADNVEIVLRTPPHSKDTLSKKILEAAQKIAHIPQVQQEAMNFSVKGMDENTKRSIEIDLLSDKLISIQSICLLNGRTKVLESRSAFSAIKKAHKKLKEELIYAPSVSHD